MTNTPTTCFCCNKPDTHIADLYCSRECQRLAFMAKRDVAVAKRREVREAIREAIRYAVKQRCRPEWDYQLSMIARFWYTFKAIICLLIGRYNNTRYPHCGVIAAVWGERPLGGEYGGCEWLELRVRRGVFSGWFADIEADSSV